MCKSDLIFNILKFNNFISLNFFIFIVCLLYCVYLLKNKKCTQQLKTLMIYLSMFKQRIGRIYRYYLYQVFPWPFLALNRRLRWCYIFFKVLLKGFLKRLKVRKWFLVQKLKSLKITVGDLIYFYIKVSLLIFYIIFFYFLYFLLKLIFFF